MLSLIYFLGVVAAYGLDFFSPTLLSQSFPELSKSAWVGRGHPAARDDPDDDPVHGRSSDARHEHRWHVAMAVFAQAAALLVLAMGPPRWFVVAAMTMAVSGRWCFIGPFWGLPTHS